MKKNNSPAPHLQRLACAVIGLLILCVSQPPARDSGIALDIVKTAGATSPVSDQQQAGVPPPESGFYRWRDAHGRIHYGPQPPQGVAAQAVDMDAASMAVIEMAPASEAQPAPQAKPQRRPQRQSSTRSSAAERRAARCAQIEERIRYTHSRLRAGYKAREGERLKDRRRALMRQRSEYCY